MKTTNVLLGAGAVALMLTALYSESAPEDNPSKIFGATVPFTLDELPPGRVREKIESLPGPAKQRAIEWLNQFSFAEEDLAFIRIDDQGGVYYEDTYLPDPSDLEESAAAEAGEPVYENITETELFALHSRPGSSNVVIVDFDGHTISGTAWNNIGGVANSLDAVAYDRDGNLSSFSQSELEEMAEIWNRIAEDFAPFDIDVTTEDFGTTNRTTGRILITRSTDANNKKMPHSTAGGVAYVGVWGRSNYDYYYSPALVYYDNLGSGWPPYVAEASSHELGHNLGLSHDGTNSTSYYSGHGSGYVSWAPIMGVGYYNQVTQWSQGEYSGATQPQDDLAIVDGYLGYRPDDHGNNMATASPLVVDASGDILVTNPETDPDNLNPDNKGVIELRSDTDYFWFNAEAGQVSLLVEPAWTAYYRDNRRGANLDIHAALYDASGSLIVDDDPTDETDASLTAPISAGVHYLAITGVGNTVVPYSDYGSLGQYFISGNITPGEPNTSPVANDDSGAGDEDNSIVIQVLDNDSDADNDTLSVSSVVSTSNGSTATNGTTVTYTPNANFNGPDNFTYTLSDGRGGTDVATVNVTVAAMNDAPVAVNDTSATDEGVSVNITVLSNDSDVEGDPLSVVSTTNGSNGTVTDNGTMVTYTPNALFAGTDNFSYTISDGNGGNANASVEVTVMTVVVVPGIPDLLEVVDGTDGTANISWSESATGGDEDGFDIQRENKHKKRNAYVGTTLVGTTGADVTTYPDASGAGDFRYRVRAFNTAGASVWTDWVYITVTGGGGGGGGGNGNGGGKGKNK